MDSIEHNESALFRAFFRVLKIGTFPSCFGDRISRAGWFMTAWF